MSEASSSLAAALAADSGSLVAPPRSNGELVFEAPWETRAFGIVVALSEQQTCDWQQFRQQLMAEIAAWEREHAGDPDARWSYYERWLASLERLLRDAGLLSEEEITARIAHLEHLEAHEHEH